MRIILLIFSFGSETWNLTESRLIQRNSMDVVGPRVFSWAMGIPSSEKTFWTVSMWAAGMALGAKLLGNRLKGG